MTSAQFVLCLTCLLLGTLVLSSGDSLVHQSRRFISARVGGSVTLQCSYESDDSAWICWYKQRFGQKPKLISSSYSYGTSDITFYDEFINNPRFVLETKNPSYYLTILDLRVSDSATYFCAVNYAKVVTFAEGTTISVETSGFTIQTLVHQSASESVQSGGSVTLNCSVQTGTCDGEHSVYWFKNSEESHPGLIYSHGGRSDQCERKPNTQTHTCVFNLPLRNLNVADDGTYYCAVASCGRILFGNGTTLNVSRKVDLMYFLAGSLTTLLVVLPIFLVYIIKKCNQSQTTGSRFPVTTRTTEGNNQDSSSLHYASIDIQDSKRQRERTNNDCIYSTVNHED